MKRLVLICAFALLSTAAQSQTIPAGQAMSHVGQAVTVEGVVGDVKTTRSGTTFIDVGGRYPDEIFAGVIFSRDAAAVGNVGNLQGKKIDISGKIELYNGRPEIIIRSRNQIRPAK